MRSGLMAECLRAFIPDADDTTMVSADGLTAWIGITPAEIEMFVRLGVLKPDEHCQFNLKASTRAAIGYWQDIIDKADAELDAIEPHGRA
jgi:hypothetical protein